LIAGKKNPTMKDATDEGLPCKMVAPSIIGAQDQSSNALAKSWP
jgi:hypothetical protein